MDMPIETISLRDADHRCPICGGETELISHALTHSDGQKKQVEVTPKRRRCVDLDCHGHSRLHDPADGWSLSEFRPATHLTYDTKVVGG